MTLGSEWITPQQWQDYSAAEHAVWDMLFARQRTQLPGRVVPSFLDGIEMLDMATPGSPDFADL